MNYDPSNPTIQTMKCPYRKSKEADPHFHEKFDPTPIKIHDNILGAIGKTPMVRLNKIPQSEGLECEILAKCEFLNPSGSMKDRIAKRMIEDAERDGKLIKGQSKLVEPSSGNTGIAFSLVAAVKGYPLTICMNEKMSQEKEDVMVGLGTNVIRTPGESKYLDPTSLYQVAQTLSKEKDNVVLDQYTNPGNTLAHYDTTGAEILFQCDNKVDVLVVGTGTAGTMTGISRKLKEVNPNCKIIAVDPFGSVLSMPQSMNEKKVPHDVEGIGKDFVPKSLDREMVDEWIKIDNAAQPMARRLLQEEGLFCGASSGGIVHVAVEYAKREKLGKDVRIVCILADNIRNYLTKFLSKEWMVDKRLIKPSELVQPEHQLINTTVEDLKLQKIPNFDENTTLQEAINQLQVLQIPALPIVNNNQKIIASVPQEKLMSYIISKKLSQTDKVSKVWTKEYSSAEYESVNAASLERLLSRRNVVFIEKQTQDGLEVYPVLHKHIFNVIKF